MNRSFFGFLGLSFVYIAAGGRGWRTLKRQRGLHRDDAAPFLAQVRVIQVSQAQKLKELKELSLPTVAGELRQQSFWRIFLSSKTYALTP